MLKFIDFYKTIIFVLILLHCNGEGASGIDSGRNLKKNDDKTRPGTIPTTAPVLAPVQTIPAPVPAPAPKPTPTPKPPKDSPAIDSSVTEKLSPFFLAFTSEPGVTFSIQENKLLDMTKERFDNFARLDDDNYDNYVDSTFTLQTSSGTTVGGRRLNEKQTKIVQISGTASFKTAPPIDKVKSLEDKAFHNDNGNEYIHLLKTEDVTYSNGKMDIKKTFEKPSLQNLNSQQPKEEISKLSNDGHGRVNLGGIFGGITGGIITICLATFLFIKSKKNKEDKLLHNNKHIEFSSPHKDEFNNFDHSHVRRQYFGEIDHTEHYNEDNDHNRGRSDIVEVPSTDVVSNDDGSVFETIYFPQIGISPSMKGYFSPESNANTTSSITSTNQRNNPIPRTISRANTPIDDTFSLDGSYALDNQGPTRGDEMLGHVLGMNSYNSENKHSPMLSIDDSIEEEGVEVDITDSGDLSSYSFSNEYNADTQSVFSRISSTIGFKGGGQKKQTISERRDTAERNNKHSPPRNDTISEGNSLIPRGNITVDDQVEQSSKFSSTKTPDYYKPSLLDDDESISSADLSTSSSLSSGILNDGQEESMRRNISTSSQHEFAPTRIEVEEGIRNQEFSEWDNTHRVVETEQTKMSHSISKLASSGGSQSMSRSSSIISERKHTITVVTEAPPPPQTPDKFPVQSLNESVRKSRFGIKRAPVYYSDSESSEEDDNECRSDDEASVEPGSIKFRTEDVPTIKQNVKAIVQPAKALVKENYPPIPNHNTLENYRPAAPNPKVTLPVYRGRVNNSRNETKFNSANARNARRKRLKSIERSKRSPNAITENERSSSKAEIASSLRKARLQQQALTPTQSGRYGTSRSQRML